MLLFVEISGRTESDPTIFQTMCLTMNHPNQMESDSRRLFRCLTKLCLLKGIYVPFLCSIVPWLMLEVLLRPPQLSPRMFTDSKKLSLACWYYHSCKLRPSRTPVVIVASE